MKTQKELGEKGENNKPVAFAQAVKIELHVEDDDTDLIIDENEINQTDVLLSQVQKYDYDDDNDEDIPLLQIHNGERMVNYRANK